MYYIHILPIYRKIFICLCGNLQYIKGKVNRNIFILLENKINASSILGFLLLFYSLNENDIVIVEYHKKSFSIFTV